MSNNINFELLYKHLMQQSYKTGTLFVIGMPIGNFGDITLRALYVLSMCHCIAAENIQHSRLLLNRYQLRKPMVSLNAYNEVESASCLIQRLYEGEYVALITDAGTPSISDPGARAVTLIRNHGFNIVPIPGPSALVTAMSVVGHWGFNSFTFHGFLPNNTRLRKKILMDIRYNKSVNIFYEAPHRIVAMLQDCLNCFEDTRLVLIARELTKIYETITYGNLREVFESIRDQKQRGEFVIVIEGSRVDCELEQTSDFLLEVLLQELSLSQSVRLVAKATGQEKNTIYQKALHLKNILDQREIR